MVEFDDRAKALAEYLSIPVEDVEIEENPYDDSMCDYKTPDGNYHVMTYDESMDALKTEAEELMLDMGIEAFTHEFQNWILENACGNSDWFSDACREFHESYATDIESEPDDEYGSRLNRECVDAGIISEDEIVDGDYVGDLDLIWELAEYLYNDDYESYSGDLSHWYIDDFGKDSLRELCKEGVLSFDFDKIAEEMENLDGFGHSLAYYDGETIELDKDDVVEYYAYRIN